MIAAKRADQTGSEYVVEAVRQRLERDQMLPDQRGVESPVARVIRKATAAAEAIGSDPVEAALDDLIIEKGAELARRESA